jgi:hypothetical protein
MGQVKENDTDVEQAVEDVKEATKDAPTGVCGCGQCDKPKEKSK